MYGIVAFVLIAAVSCNDLIQGPEVGRNIYNVTKEASPAIWKQKDEVTIKVNDTDVISRIVITDKRPNKDGEVKILEGGQGQKNVTLELKSPTILRGYDFHIEVYAVNENDQEIYTEEPPSTEISGEVPKEVPEIPKEIPVMENDTKVNNKNEDSVAPTEKTIQEVEAPVNTDTKTVKIDPIVKPVQEKVTETLKPEVPENIKPIAVYPDTRKTVQTDPIVKPVQEKVTETLKPEAPLEVPENTEAIPVEPERNVTKPDEGHVHKTKD